MKRYVVPLILVMLFFIYVQPVFAQSTDENSALKKEMEGLKESQKAMQKDIQEIKNLLSARQTTPGPKEAIISLDDNPFKGDENAKVTIVEFSDYQ